MGLFELLRERKSVNLLYFLHIRDSNKQFATPFVELSKSGFAIKDTENLLELNLVSKEIDTFTITEKGRKFVLLLDDMKNVLFPQTKQEKTIKIQYVLDDFEKRVIFFIKKISGEVAFEQVKLTTLNRELFPYAKSSNASAKLARAVSNLSDLNLVKKEKVKNRVILSLTSSGHRVVSELIVVRT